MEENVPLESDSRKKFEKAIKGIKKMLKNSEKSDKNVEVKPKKVNSNTPESRDRGVVYIGHIPHGFYEDQMTSYFKQFGKVTNARVARSKKTGKSKGYAFVEFQNKEVAQIVAQTMNNYLMDKRLIKAEYVPPEKQRATFFLGPKWTAGKKTPGIIRRNKVIKVHNRPITDEEWINDSKKQLKKLAVLKSKLKKMDIDYDFFQPCDIPEQLVDYDPFKPNQNNVASKETGDSSKKEKKSDPDTSSQMKNTKKNRKEKSMKKPVSPIVKPYKKKENKNIGKFVRPLLTTNLDLIAEKKQKKNKSKEVKVSSQKVELVKNTTENLIKKKDKKNKKLKIA